MDKRLVQLKNTGGFLIIDNNDFDEDIHFDRSLNIAYWHKYRKLTDYCLTRYCISQALEQRAIDSGFEHGFDTLTLNEEKDICLIYTKTVPVDKGIMYYISKGMTQEEATKLYINKRNIDITNSAKVYKERIYSSGIRLILLTNVSQDIAENIAKDIYSFREQVASDAMLGTNYGNSSYGIMDYIESTSSDVQGGMNKYFDMTDPVQVDIYNNIVKLIKDKLYYGFTKIL